VRVREKSSSSSSSSSSNHHFWRGVHAAMAVFLKDQASGVLTLGMGCRGETAVVTSSCNGPTSTRVESVYAYIQASLRTHTKHFLHRPHNNNNNNNHNNYYYNFRSHNETVFPTALAPRSTRVRVGMRTRTGTCARQSTHSLGKSPIWPTWKDQEYALQLTFRPCKPDWLGWKEYETTAAETFEKKGGWRTLTLNAYPRPPSPAIKATLNGSV
jgi:hypothetical protein